jgi:hypothetical protein
MVYDVLDLHNHGVSREEIAMTYNLTFRQVDVALEYIEQHRKILEAELAEIKVRKAKDEAKYRAMQREIELKAETLPMTRERKAFYQLQEANKRKRESANDSPDK